MSHVIELANPGIGDASFLQKHKKLLTLLKEFPTVKLETWTFEQTMCGGFIYQFTVKEHDAENFLDQLETLQFVNTYCAKGKLVDNESVLCAKSSEIF